MEKVNLEKCQTCGKKAHNYENEEIMDCVPPKDVLKFGGHTIDKSYRNTLYEQYPFYTAEEIVGSYLGHNPYFVDQETWLEEQNNLK